MRVAIEFPVSGLIGSVWLPWVEWLRNVTYVGLEIKGEIMKTWQRQPVVPLQRQLRSKMQTLMLIIHVFQSTVSLVTNTCFGTETKGNSEMPFAIYTTGWLYTALDQI